MKTEFELDATFPTGSKATVSIIGAGNLLKWKPYVSFRIKTPNAVHVSGCIQDKDLERFAVNILKALKSDKLK